MTPNSSFFARLLIGDRVPAIVARIASRVAATAGDEIIARIARTSTREQIDALRDVLTPEQFAMAVALHDLFSDYARRGAANKTDSNTNPSRTKP